MQEGTRQPHIVVTAPGQPNLESLATQPDNPNGPEW